ncbi:hypothetical protein [Streptomyces sp. NPDC050560]|uniref:hypothetical protein n=1 Tax=Streptomyces sp. NPDC050560 TaxID=3365630 RepID=UPI00378C8CC7
MSKDDIGTDDIHVTDEPLSDIHVTDEPVKKKKPADRTKNTDATDGEVGTDDIHVTDEPTTTS